MPTKSDSPRLLHVHQALDNITITCTCTSFASAMSIADSLTQMHHVPAAVWQDERCIYDAALGNVVMAWNGIAREVQYQ